MAGADGDPKGRFVHLNFFWDVAAGLWPKKYLGDHVSNA